MEFITSQKNKSQNLVHEGHIYNHHKDNKDGSKKKLIDVKSDIQNVVLVLLLLKEILLQQKVLTTIYQILKKLKKEKL
jgi:hypothetical protein